MAKHLLNDADVHALLAARMRSVTAVPPGDALNLEPCPDHTGLQVHIRPAEAKGFTLTYAESKSDRPSSAAPLHDAADAPAAGLCAWGRPPGAARTTAMQQPHISNGSSAVASQMPRVVYLASGCPTRRRSQSPASLVQSES